MKKESTGCSRILHILNDGEWHTAAELYRSTASVVHSRIADLRKRGYMIEHRRTTGTDSTSHQYRLYTHVREEA